MILRRLEESDANNMLAWMHDNDVVDNLPTRFENFTLEDCMRFIEQSNSDDKNLHMAICTDDNTYVGTVSLKNISLTERNAEYAITISKSAMGMGVSMFATEEILKIAFEQIGLHRVYLCVFSDNLRAKKFYHKLNFSYEGTWKQHRLHKDGLFHDIEWYAILESDYRINGVKKPCDNGEKNVTCTKKV